MRLQTNPPAQAEERIPASSGNPFGPCAITLEALGVGGQRPVGRAAGGRVGMGAGLQTTGRLVGSQRENQTNQPGKRTYKHTNERASYPNERTDGQTPNTINDTAALDGINKRNSGLL